MFPNHGNRNLCIRILIRTENLIADKNISDEVPFFFSFTISKLHGIIPLILRRFAIKKKSLFLIFSIVMTLSLSSCGSKSENFSTSAPSQSAETAESSDKSVDEIAAEESYTLSEQEKADLRALGATEEQINSVKSGQDFVDLVYSLVDSGSNTGKSGSTAGEKEESNITNDSNTVPESDTLPPAQGIPEEDTLPGSM